MEVLKLYQATEIEASNLGYFSPEILVFVSLKIVCLHILFFFPLLSNEDLRIEGSRQLRFYLSHTYL